jgi:GntR family transcriptional regulator, carbon starvation induced regulator
MSLIAACTSKRMIAACSAMFDHAERYRRISSMNRQTPRDARKEHRRLMELALDRKATAAAALLRDHVSRTADSVTHIIESGALPAARRR